MRHKLIGSCLPWHVSDTGVEIDEDGFRHIRAHKKAVNRPVKLVYDPSDTYPRNGYFSMHDLYFTAFFGYWPDGAVFEVTCKNMGGRLASGKKNRRVQVVNGLLVDVLNNEKHIFWTKNRHKWVPIDAQYNLPDRRGDCVK